MEGSFASAPLLPQYTFFAVAGGKFAELLSQGHEIFVVKVGVGEVDEPVELPLCCCDHLRMGRAGAEHGYPRREIDEPVPVDGGPDRANGRLDDERVVSRNRWRNDLRRPPDDGPRPRSGEVAAHHSHALLGRQGQSPRIAVFLKRPLTQGSPWASTIRSPRQGGSAAFRPWRLRSHRQSGSLLSPPGSRTS